MRHTASRMTAAQSLPSPVTLRSPKALAEAGLVAPERLPALERVAAQYAVAITLPMAELIDATDPNDPIARQFVPTEPELHTLPEESGDPSATSPIRRSRGSSTAIPTAAC